MFLFFRFPSFYANLKIRKIEWKYQLFISETAVSVIIDDFLINDRRRILGQNEGFHDAWNNQDETDEDGLIHVRWVDIPKTNAEAVHNWKSPSINYLQINLFVFKKLNADHGLYHPTKLLSFVKVKTLLPVWPKNLTISTMLKFFFNF